MDMKLEVIVVPVADRAEAFYKALAWLDADFVANETLRMVHLTPPGSPCSIIIGAGITSATPGSGQGRQLVVTDIEAGRANLADRGAAVSEAFHDLGGVFHYARTGRHEQQIGRLDPDWLERRGLYLEQGQARGPGQARHGAGT
ncbi:MAG: VOC family protein [Streptosporangiaceae bacterium]